MLARALPIYAIALLAPIASVASESRDFQRGMVISCPRWGPIWGAPAMSESLAELRSLGVDSVAIHPYGWVKRDGAVEFRPAATLDFLSRAVEFSRSAGMDLFWKPHLGYWGQFEWRGAIEFGDDESRWRRFFVEYERFIVDQARFAESAGIDLFAVGVELEATTHREQEWRRVIASVREVYTGTLVYAANWDRLAGVPFWDAVDWIGIHAYFPLSQSDDPDRGELLAGWEPHLAELRRISAAEGKPVLIAEIGYNLHPGAAREPWRYETVDSSESRALRARLIDVAIERLAQEDFVRGMYWWKWMPGGTHNRRNFSMRDPGAKQVLSERWGAGSAAPSR